jgi:hypothetical protein
VFTWKFSRILWRRARPKLGCGAKERRRRSVYLEIKTTTEIGPNMTMSLL